MPDPRRTPWIAIDVDIRKDVRVADLPSDGARWGYVAGVLAESRLQSPRGVFGSRATFEEAVGRFARYLEQYLAVGLMERAPKLCDRCAAAHPDLRQGALVVHNWGPKQSDPTSADRARRRRAARNGAEHESDHDDRTTTAQRPDDDRLTTGRRPATHARAPRHQTQTPNTKEDSGSTGVRPREAINGAEASSAAPRREEPGASAKSEGDLIELGRPDVEALRRRGWTRVTPGQIERLDEVADYERASERDVESGQRVVASWILGAPKGADVLAHVFATSRRLRDERQGQADARAEEHERQKRGRLHPSIGGATP